MHKKVKKLILSEVMTITILLSICQITELLKHITKTMMCLLFSHPYFPKPCERLIGFVELMQEALNSINIIT